VFTKHEKEKIASDGLGFILFLEQARILNSVEREIILDQAMMINQSRINIDEIRWIVMMTLWNNNRENDYLFVENTLYQSKQSELH
jgi:Smg protein